MAKVRKILIQTKEMNEKISFMTPLQELREKQQAKVLELWDKERAATPENISDHRVMVEIAEELRTCSQTVYKILKRNGKIQPKQIHKPHKRRKERKQ